MYFLSQAYRNLQLVQDSNKNPLKTLGVRRPVNTVSRLKYITFELLHMNKHVYCVIFKSIYYSNLLIKEIQQQQKKEEKKTKWVQNFYRSKTKLKVLLDSAPSYSFQLKWKNP